MVIDHVPPSGRQYTLRAGDQEAVVVEVGGGLRSYRVGSREVIDGYGDHQMCSGGRGQVLVPWPNRVRDGSYRFDGAEHQLALTEPPHHNAIHGLARYANWAGTEQAPDRVLMTHRLHPQPGYPFCLDLEVDYCLGADGLSVAIAATSRAQRSCPYGAGMHPYVTVGTQTIDTAVLTSPAGVRLDVDERQIPIGRRTVTGTEDDFRTGRAIGATVLDTGYTDLERDADGRARVRLRGPDRDVVLWMDETFGYLMLFSGDTLGDVGRRRCSLAIEPMTCAPNALQSGDGLVVLEPGQRHESMWGITAA